MAIEHAAKPARLDIPRTSRRALHALKNVWPVALSTVIVFSLWEIVGRSVPPLFFAPFSRTVAALWELLLSGRLLENLAISGLALAWGMGIGITIGLLGAIGSYASRFFREFTDTWTIALYTTPYVVLTPLFIIWLGLGIESKIALVVVATFIPIWFSTYTGLATTDRQLKEVAQAFGANPFEVFRHVIFPWALPNIITGFRLALSRGMVAVIVGEFIGADSGIGVLIYTASRTFDAPTILASVIVIAIIALTIIELMRWLQRKLVPWWEEKPKVA